MELKEKIELLRIGSGDCPPGVSPGGFANLLSSVRNGKNISDVSRSLLNLICDIKFLNLKLRRSPLSELAIGLTYVKALELHGLIFMDSAEIFKEDEDAIK